MQKITKGLVLTINFQLEGQDFIALNGGPVFKCTEAIYFSIGCKPQAEIGELLGKLTADGGEPSQCSWLKDKHGVLADRADRVAQDVARQESREIKSGDPGNASDGEN